jgi:TolB-like protein/class 3 adenylate cyclase/Tfp pilus assembly protein PilF
MRQLAAIMFTDIVGYTALMGKDNTRALALVHKSRDIQKPLVEKHHGKWLKEMGDGALAQFNTAVDAVNCAIEIQKLARAEFDGKLRIGVHLGDITFEENDVYGDGVNVASRLESIADPGGIYISESIDKAIRGETDIKTLFLGESHLKNVDYDVRIFAVQGVGLPVPDIADGKRKPGSTWNEIIRRGLLRVVTVYIAFSLFLILLVDKSGSVITLPGWSMTVMITVLILLFPLAIYLAWNYEKSPEGFVRTASLQAKENPFNTEQKKPLTNSFIIIGLLLIILVMYFYPKLLTSDIPGRTTELGPIPINKSIAVLPFKNLSGSDDNRYFSDGVMEAILNNLSRIRDLKVVSRTSVEKYRNLNMSIRDIARELEVANILEGSVQRVGDEVRITAQLISAENDEHIWADNYDRRLTDIFSIQSEIAQTIAENLEVILTMEERELIKNAPTSNLKAYELYLKAYYAETNSEEGIKNAVEMFNEVIKLDPDFAQAYAYKAVNYAQLSLYGYPRSLWYDSAMALLDLAIDKDPNAWEAYFGKARIHGTVHEDKESLYYLNKTIELNPNFHWAYHLLGEYALTQKEYDKAIDYLLKSASLVGMNEDESDFQLDYGYFLQDLDREQACLNFYSFYERNPKSYGVIQELVTCARYFKDYEKGLEYAQKCLNLRPDLVNAKNIVALSYLTLNRYGEAERYYREMMSTADQFENDYMIYPFAHRLGYAMMKNDKKEEGLKIMEAYRDTLIAHIERREIKASAIGEYYDLATIYAALDQKEEALKWLKLAREKETEGAFCRIDFLTSDPMLDNLREEPEFKKLLDEKYQEMEEIKQLFYEKVALYHANNELKWLKNR